MEDRLHRLIEGNSEKNRVEWALEWKRQGKKVIGIMSSYVPEEVISAAGMLPWRITGAARADIGHAMIYRDQNSCGYCNHVLELFLSGDLDFLDGVVTTDQDQDLLRLWDVLISLGKIPFCYALHVPFVDSEVNYRFLTGEIQRLISGFNDFWNITITESDLHSSIETCNETRNLLRRMYELRKKEIPPLSGAEVLGIVTAAMVMPKKEFNRELEILLPHLEMRETKLKRFSPRLLITSDMLDNPAYISLIEENALVAMDDMDTGSRYFIGQVDGTLDDPAYALAKRYISRHGAPRMASWDKQIDQVLQWVKEFRIDGVLGLPLAWCYPQRFRMPFLTEKLRDAGIPSMSFEREYYFTNAGQLKTRIGAFLEMLGG